MSLLDVIASFSTAAADGVPEGYHITRVALGVYDEDTGLYTPGPTSTLLADASVQPYGGRGLEPLPQGVHAHDVRVIYTATELQVVPTPDVIVIRGEAFKVYQLNGPFTLDGVSTFTGYAARQVVP